MSITDKLHDGVSAPYGADSSPDDTTVRSVPSQTRRQDQVHDQDPSNLHWSGQGLCMPNSSGLAAQPLLGRPPEAERAFAWPSGWVASTPLPPSWGPPGRRSAKPSPGTAGHACPQPRAVRQWAIVAGCRVVRLESHFLRQLCAVSIGSEGISVHAWRCSDARGQGWLWSLARRLMNATRAA